MLDQFDERGLCKHTRRSYLSIKDKQIIISRLDKEEKGTNLAPEFGISKQQISDISKNKDKILKFTASLIFIFSIIRTLDYPDYLP